MTYEQALAAAKRQSAMHGSTLTVRRHDDGKSFYVSQILVHDTIAPALACVNKGDIVWQTRPKGAI